MGEGGARSGRLDPNACEPSLRVRPFAVPAAFRCGRRPPWCARARCTEHGRRGRVRRLGCAVKDLRVGDVVVYQSPIDHQKTVIKRIAALVPHRIHGEPLQSAPRGERLACRGSPWSPARSPRASPLALTSGNRNRKQQSPARTAAPLQMWAGVRLVPVQMWAGVGPVLVQMWAGVGPVPGLMWQGWAQARCRSGRNGPSPGADLAGVGPVPACLQGT